MWSISGTDASLGGYSGRLEIRAASDGSLVVNRVISLEELVHHDGRAIDVVWTGGVQSSSPEAATLQIVLLRADFIPQVGPLVRTATDASPLQVVGNVSVGEDRALSAAYSAPADPGFSAVETGVLEGPPGADPIFRSGRFVPATHREPDPITRALLFNLFESFHRLPAVQPFTTEPKFRRAVHFQVIERTDFDFYRANPERIRVVVSRGWWKLAEAA